jgi:hypothetical protein
MNDEKVTIQDVLLNLKGKPAWGFVRTHGSMFFLEMGKPLPRVGEKKVHGEWHFLVEMCHWRIETHDSILIGSDDEQELIDSSFFNLELGHIESAAAPSPSHDLHIVFSSGIRLSTFTTSAAAKEQWKQWQLYTPDDNVWIADASGCLAQRNAYA